MNNSLPVETLEDKKLIENRKLIIDKVMKYSWVAEPLTYRGVGGHLSHINNFHPSGIHFYEVIGRLEGETKKILELWCSNYCTSRMMSYLDRICYAESNKANIMAELIEILKEGN